MLADYERVLYANEIGVHVSQVDVLLNFAVRFGAGDEDVKTMTQVALAREVAEAFYHFLGQRLGLEPVTEIDDPTEAEPT